MADFHEMINLPQVSIVTSFDGLYLGPIYTEYRINASYSELPRHLIEAVVSAEDKRFFSHKGFDLIALFRACRENIKHLSIRQGGSTITQQLARNAIIHSNEKTLKRKLLELLVSIRIENIATKEEILEAYLNAIYWGRSIFGVKIAAWEYLGKDLSSLDLNESAYLAGLIRAPNRYLQTEELVNKRKNQVLDLMCVNNFLNKEDLLKYKAINIPFKTHHALPSRQIIAGYYLDYVKKYLLDNHADHFPLRQMSIATYFDQKCQEAIDRTIEEFAPVIEQQKICCLVTDNNSGGVKAMRSGVDYESEFFNIAVDGYLQPASTLKPFILAEALNQGFSLETKFESRELCIDIPGGQKWQVRNFNDVYRGNISLAEALIYSDNTVFAQLMLHLDWNKLKALLKAVGIDVGIPTPALATGATNKGVSPLQIAAAFTIFSNRGYYLPPTPIMELKTITGEKLFENEVLPRYALENSIADEVDDVLRRVVTEGTGTFNNALIPNLRAKTGTKDSYSWYVSYDDNYHLVTWVGENCQDERDSYGLNHIPPQRIEQGGHFTQKNTTHHGGKQEKAITAKRLSERIWQYLTTKNNLGDFLGVAEGINKFNSTQVSELEGYFMPWGKYGKIRH